MKPEKITGHYDPQVVSGLREFGVLHDPGDQATPLEIAHRLGVVSLSEGQLAAFGITQPQEPEV